MSKGEIMNEKDLTEVLCELLTEIRTLNSRVGDLARVIGKEPATDAPPTVPQSDKPWFVKAREFLVTPEAELLAAKRSLTADAIMRVAGLSNAAVGHRRYIGKLLKDAGFSRVTEGDVQVDYRRLSAAP